MISELKSERQLLLFAAATVGFATPLFAPQDWILGIFIGAIAFSALLAIGLAIDTKETKPTQAFVGILALLIIGTSRPRADIATGPLSNYFFATVIFLVCFTTSLLVFSHA